MSYQSTKCHSPLDKTCTLCYTYRVRNKSNKVGATFALVILLILQIDEMILLIAVCSNGNTNGLIKNSVKHMFNTLSTKVFTLSNHSSNLNQSNKCAPSTEVLSVSVNHGKKEHYLR